MKKIKILLIFLLIMLLATGCGDKEQTSISNTENKVEMTNTENTNRNESIVNEDKGTKDNGVEVKEGEIGRLTIFKKSEEVNAFQESGPFTVKVNKMQVAN